MLARLVMRKLSPERLIYESEAGQAGPISILMLHVPRRPIATPRPINRKTCTSYPRGVVSLRCTDGCPSGETGGSPHLELPCGRMNTWPHARPDTGRECASDQPCARLRSVPTSAQNDGSACSAAAKELSPSRHSRRRINGGRQQRAGTPTGSLALLCHLDLGCARGTRRLTSHLGRRPCPD